MKHFFLSLLVVSIFLPFGNVFAQELNISPKVAPESQDVVSVQAETLETSLKEDNSIIEKKDTQPIENTAQVPEDKPKEEKEKSAETLPSNESEAQEKDQTLSSGFAEGDRLDIYEPQTDPFAQVNGLKELFSNDLFTGAASFRIPFQIPGPPNKNALTPSLSLNYNSYSRERLSSAGFGWEIGENSIFRQTRHGNSELYKRNDFSFKINGKNSDLTLVDASRNLYMAKQGNDLSQYFFENNSWRVLDTNGTTYYFGSGSSTRQSHPDDGNKIFQWMLEKVIDPSGNSIEYTYFKDHNQIYLDTIRYGNIGTSYLYQIDIQHIQKSISSIDYQTQFPIETYWLLESVNIQHFENNAWVTKHLYRLSYDSLNATISHLLTVTEAAGTSSLPPLRFSYYSSGQSINLLQSVNNGIGASLSFSYLPSTAYRSGSNASNFIPFIVSTLSKIDSSDVVTNITSLETFEYFGGHYFIDYADIFGREYAGFHEVIKKESDRVTKTFFHQSQFSKDNGSSDGEYQDHIAKKGSAYRVEVYDISGVLFQSSITKWIHQSLGNDRYFVFPERITRLQYDGRSTHDDTASTYLYDDYANVIETKEYGLVQADSSTGDFTDIGSDIRKTAMTYALNTSSNLVSFPSSQKLSDFSGNTVSKIEWYYDGSSELGFIQKGKMTKEKMYAENPNGSREHGFSYNARGNLESSTDFNGNLTTYSYDATHPDFPQMITAQGTNDSRDLSTSYTYDFGLAALTQKISPNGFTTEFFYDPFGRFITKYISSNTDVQNMQKSESYEYHETSSPAFVEKKIFPSSTVIIVSRSYFDGFGRVIQSKSQHEDNQYITADTKYDAMGNLIFSSHPYFSNSLNFDNTSWNQNNLGIKTTYDGLKRPRAMASSVGETTYQYEGFKSTVTDPKGIQKDYFVDPFGNLVRVTEHNGSERYDTYYSYNSLNLLTNIIDAKGNTRNFTYNAYGFRLSLQDIYNPNNPPAIIPTWNYSYDSNGNVLTQTDPDAKKITYTYDEFSRVTKESWDSGTQFTYTYSTSSISKGLPILIASDSVTSAYDYDAHGNVTSENKNIEGENFATAFSSDLIDRLTFITYPENYRVDYGYNSGGFLETVSGTDGSKTTDFVSDIDYSPLGQITSFISGSGIITNNIYDPNELYRLRSRVSSLGTTSLQNLTFGYDKIGNIISLVDGSATATAKNVSYGYDDLSRLVSGIAGYNSSQKNYNHTYSYDALGNMLSRTDVGSYQYSGLNNANPHAATKIGNTDLYYDTRGNMISDGQRILTYDQRNLISRSVYNGLTADFVYDHSGNRVLKKTSNDTVWYPNQYYEIRATKGGEKNYRYIFAGSNRIASIEGSTVYDRDSDGSNADSDCNDNDATVHPGAMEICGDSIDQDCSGADLSCNDVDNDGDGYTENGGDCNDGNAEIKPGAVEACGDSIDQDCNGADLSCSDADQDGDSYSVNEGDCNDNDASVHPGAIEIPYNGKDDDCLALQTPDDDLDQDDYPIAEDCDDTTDDIYPGATEICGDGIDQDCSGADETCAPDRDGDGIPDSTDNCPDIRSSNQMDSDGDGKGNICDNDTRLKYTFTPDADPLKIVDSTNYKNHGTIDSSRKPKINNLTDWAKGYAAYFDGGTDGSSDNIYLNDNDSLSYYQGLTVSAWIKPDTVTGHHSMLSKWGKENSNWEWDFYIQDGKLSLMLNAEDSECGGTETFAYVESRLIAAKKWTHVTATYDGSTIRFYINGTAYPASSQSKMPIEELCDTAEKVRLGVSGYYDNDYIGYTDEVKISNYAKSNKEVCEQEMGYKWQMAASKCKPVDFDKDGYTVVQGDCDDLNPQKYSGNGCSAVDAEISMINTSTFNDTSNLDVLKSGEASSSDDNEEILSSTEGTLSKESRGSSPLFSTHSFTDQEIPRRYLLASKSNFQDSQVPHSTVYYFLQDHLGNTTVVTDEQGNIVEVMDYLPFGSMNVHETYGSHESDYTFTGKEKDSEEDLYYFGARYLSDSTSRFTSVDPVSRFVDSDNYFKDPQQWNFYSYTRNNPINFIDFLGLYSEVVIRRDRDGHGKDWGHASINVDGTYYDFLQKNSNSWYDEGNVRIQSEKDFFGGYGIKQQDEFAIVVLNTTDEEEQIMVDFFTNLQKDTPDYNIFDAFGENCTTTVVDALEKADLFHFSIFGPTTPEQLISFFKSQYVNLNEKINDLFAKSVKDGSVINTYRFTDADTRRDKNLKKKQEKEKKKKESEKSIK
ncbi:DUF4105 domain-containing protein [Candidatus Peregrinibacteria bacterium]|nr:DUF4105 domain-containing protein [Candidatus Peregrinibacteria bacterium]